LWSFPESTVFAPGYPWKMFSSVRFSWRTMTTCWIGDVPPVGVAVGVGSAVGVGVGCGGVGDGVGLADDTGVGVLDGVGDGVGPPCPTSETSST
jgi:hypothetical protein